MCVYVDVYVYVRAKVSSLNDIKDEEAVPVCMWMHVHGCGWMCMDVCACGCGCMWMHVDACVWMCVRIRMHVCTYACVRTHVCILVCA